jgi:hypothetical protein
MQNLFISLPVPFIYPLTLALKAHSLLLQLVSTSIFSLEIASEHVEMKLLT